MDERDEVTEAIYEWALEDGEPWAETAHEYRTRPGYRCPHGSPRYLCVYCEERHNDDEHSDWLDARVEIAGPVARRYEAELNDGSPNA